MIVSPADVDVLVIQRYSSQLENTAECRTQSPNRYMSSTAMSDPSPYQPWWSSSFGYFAFDNNLTSNWHQIYFSDEDIQVAQAFALQ